MKLFKVNFSNKRTYFSADNRFSESEITYFMNKKNISDKITLFRQGFAWKIQLDITPISSGGGTMHICPPPGDDIITHAIVKEI